LSRANFIIEESGSGVQAIGSELRYFLWIQADGCLEKLPENRLKEISTDAAGFPRNPQDYLFLMY
jgi:hypothetical protein